MQIDIDFEVFKALTLRRQSESHTYNDVLHELLGIQGNHLAVAADASQITDQQGRLFAGRFLPNGTRFRVTYKQQRYEAEIVDGELVDEAGRMHSSASAAARAVTNTTVNGLTFWQVKRPGDTVWRKLGALPKAAE